MEKVKYLRTRSQRARALGDYASGRRALQEREIRDVQALGTDGHYVPNPLLPSRLERVIFGEEFSYHTAFKVVLPEGTNLKTDIQETLGDRSGEAIGVAFGGLGSRLFGDLPKGFFARSRGVALVDSRSMLQRMDDAESNHGVIVGDETADATKGLVDRWLGGQKVDLIIERMMGDLNDVPHDIPFLQRQFTGLYDMLSEGGLMYIQVPKFATKLASLWVEAAREQSLGTIDIRQGIYNSNKYGSTTVLRIHKLPGAPTELPVISPREVRDLYKVA